MLMSKGKPDVSVSLLAALLGQARALSSDGPSAGPLPPSGGPSRRAARALRLELSSLNGLHSKLEAASGHGPGCERRWVQVGKRA